MFNDIKDYLIDTSARFERKFKDVKIYLSCDDFGTLYIRMVDKINSGGCIEAILSDIQIKDANCNIFWITLENMRRNIIKYNNRGME